MKKIIFLVLVVAYADVWATELEIRPGYNKEASEALFQAVGYGDLEAAKQAIEAGADVNVRDVFGDTLLHDAAYKNLKEFINVLIAAGANVNARDFSGRTPLHWALDEGSNRAIEALLLAEAVIPDELSLFQVEQLDSVIEKINKERELYNDALRGFSALRGKAGRMQPLMFEWLYAPRLPLASEVYAQRQAAEAI
ncbi:ankyrin repeat domain-containing protein [Candidatus Babeliales bacterium]|nr:ankyrin repeat domain-containing protein [Candidatus Babeliales bacterium]